MSRKASIKRTTKETDIAVTVNLDGTGKVASDTGIKFLDHLLVSFGKHALLDIKIKSRSNDDIVHHLIEDTAIAVGSCIDKALGARAGITRFGSSSVPMDESLADASIDLVRRPYSMVKLGLRRTKIEDISREDIEHFFLSLVQNMNSCIHVTVRYGNNDHHKAECAIKSLAVALRTAVSPDRRQKGIPSTKGAM